MKDMVSMADEVRSGRVSAVELVKDCFARIESRNDDVNAFVYWDEERALKLAEEIDQKVQDGVDPGLLAGVPFGVKDLEDCAGMPTSQCSLLFKGSEPKLNDSILVSRMRAAGAIPIGKVAASEFGMDSATNTKAWGVCRNPWNLEKTSGGSSGGSATAVSAGIVPICTASDAGGSTRGPAANTGLVGLKPSMGRIPRESSGSTYTSPGAVTHTVRDTARFLDAVAGPHNRDRMSLPPFEQSYEQLMESLSVEGLRVVWSSDLGYIPVESELESIVHEAAKRLIDVSGMQQIDMDVKITNVFPSFIKLVVDHLRVEWEAEGILPDRLSEMSTKLQATMNKYPKILDPLERIKAHGATYEVEKDVAKLFEQVDVVLTPVTVCAPYQADALPPTEINGRSLEGIGAENFPIWSNASWNPSISVPAGVTRDGLPVGLMITGPRHRDDIVLRLARVFENNFPWEHVAPDYRGL